MSTLSLQTPTAVLKSEVSSGSMHSISISPPFRITEEGEIRTTEDGEALLLE